MVLPQRRKGAKKAGLICDLSLRLCAFAPLRLCGRNLVVSPFSENCRVTK